MVSFPGGMRPSPSDSCSEFLLACRAPPPFFQPRQGCILRSRFKTRRGEPMLSLFLRLLSGGRKHHVAPQVRA